MGQRPSDFWDWGFESRRGPGCFSVVSVMCCQVEVSASGRSPVQRSPTKCDVSECDREISTMRLPWPKRGCCAMGEEDSTAQLYIVEKCANFFNTSFLVQRKIRTW